MPAILHPNTDFDQVMARLPDGSEVILVKQDGVVHGYRNRCPHVGVGLDWGDGRCLSAPGELMCSMHGALFEAGTGLCIAGPCCGAYLERVPVSVRAGRVVAGGPEEPA